MLLLIILFFSVMRRAFFNRWRAWRVSEIDLSWLYLSGNNQMSSNSILWKFMKSGTTIFSDLCPAYNITWRAPLNWMQAWSDCVPVSALTGTSLPRRPPHPSLWCWSSLTLLAIWQPEPSHCASLLTQHLRLSGVPLRRPDSLELAARWT